MDQSNVWEDLPDLVALKVSDEVPSCLFRYIRLAHGTLSFEIFLDLWADFLEMLHPTFTKIDVAHVDQFPDLIHGGIFRDRNQMHSIMGSSRSSFGFIYSMADIVVTLAC